MKLPVRVAESVTDAPTVMADAERIVVMVGFALFTGSGSHALLAPALLESPLYAAFQLKLPVLLKVCDAELGTTPLVTGTGKPTTVLAPAQAELE